MHLNVRPVWHSRTSEGLTWKPGFYCTPSEVDHLALQFRQKLPESGHQLLI